MQQQQQQQSPKKKPNIRNTLNANKTHVANHDNKMVEHKRKINCPKKIKRTNRHSQLPQRLICVLCFCFLPQITTASLRTKADMNTFEEFTVRRSQAQLKLFLSSAQRGKKN